MQDIKQQVSDLLKAHGLDFKIEKALLFAHREDESQLVTPYYGLINCETNEVINTVKKGYTVSQNDEVIELVLTGMQKFGDQLKVHNAGSLDGGRKVFMQLEIQGEGRVGDDFVTRYVTIIDSNDGSASLSIGIGDVTMSCQNQFTKFYKAGDAKFRHTATIEQKMKGIPTLIEGALNESLKQIELYNEFLAYEITKHTIHELVKFVLGYDREITSMEKLAEKSTRSINKMDALYNHIEKETNGKGMNLWGLHSGVTSFTTHELKGPKRTNGQLESSMIGAGYKMNQQSLKFATKLVGAVELV